MRYLTIFIIAVVGLLGLVFLLPPFFHSSMKRSRPIQYPNDFNFTARSRPDYHHHTSYASITQRLHLRLQKILTNLTNDVRAIVILVPSSPWLHDAETHGLDVPHKNSALDVFVAQKYEALFSPACEAFGLLSKVPVSKRWPLPFPSTKDLEDE
eukprot:PhF_6_TR30192/c0_g1_i2/m.44362